MVRLISGGADLLVGVGIIGKLDITVGFGKRKFHIGMGEWRVATRNRANRCVIPLVPTARGYAKSEEYSPGVEVEI